MMFDVLDKGFVIFEGMLGGDFSIVNAARVSFAKEHDGGDEEDRKLIHFLMAHEHGTPFEHAVFRFRVKAPELVFRQWVRHRIGSFNVQSRRYTEVEEEDFYIPSPDMWRGEPHTDDLEVWRCQKALTYNLKEDIELAIESYQIALRWGVPREQARLFLLGYAVYSTFIWTVNARSLMNFLKQRLSPHAQWEIRQYAQVIWEIFKEKLPWTAGAFEEYVLPKDIEND